MPRMSGIGEVTVTELRKHLKDYVGSMQRTVVTRDNRPASILMHVKDYAHREALLDWALGDPQGWAEAMQAHHRVQAEGAGGIELEDLAKELQARRQESG